MTEHETASIKEKGNSCLKEKKYEEAVLHYTHAIKIDTKNHILYSNRSLAFLKLQQYYLALEDAKETIRLKPEWAKGYFRKAEVEFQTFNFNDALLSYKIALNLQLNDPSLEEAIQKTKIAIRKEKSSDNQIPWVGAAMGIFLGALIVIADQVFIIRPVFGNPILMTFTTIFSAILGYMIANSCRNYLKSQRVGLLEPPVNLFNDSENFNSSVEKELIESEKEVKTKKSKAQARHRFRKNKM